MWKTECAERAEADSRHLAANPSVEVHSLPSGGEPNLTTSRLLETCLTLTHDRLELEADVVSSNPSIYIVTCIPYSQKSSTVLYEGHQRTVTLNVY